MKDLVRWGLSSGIPTVKQFLKHFINSFIFCYLGQSFNFMDTGRPVQPFFPCHSTGLRNNRANIGSNQKSSTKDGNVRFFSGCGFVIDAFSESNPWPA